MTCRLILSQREFLSKDFLRVFQTYYNVLFKTDKTTKLGFDRVQV